MPDFALTIKFKALHFNSSCLKNSIIINYSNGNEFKK